MKRKHQKTLEAIFARPVSANIRWSDIETLLISLGAKVEERKGSRVVVIFPNHTPAVFHRPHPSSMTDKGAVGTIRNWLISLGYRP
ncbi:type II toxin-antitoxin system HicA family toxin [bacterium]|nr:type II toxin-antitoxin system HicA family toxin [bacterium]MBU1614748.1 type II toxin-antitoxin system HicA family toxin [bacterium]